MRAALKAIAHLTEWIVGSKIQWIYHMLQYI